MKFGIRTHRFENVGEIFAVIATDGNVTWSLDQTFRDHQEALLAMACFRAEDRLHEFRIDTDYWTQDYAS